MSTHAPRWKGIVGESLSLPQFLAHTRGLIWSPWRPSRIVLHNTGAPSLAQRPNGLTRQHILNLETYYKGLRWSAGPHLFIDDKQIWLFTKLTTLGVHSPSWNSVALGVEMLGDYSIESFDTGRGAKVRDITIGALAAICQKLNLNPRTAIKLHKEDKLTNHDCPGRNVKKADVVARVESQINLMGDVREAASFNGEVG